VNAAAGLREGFPRPRIVAILPAFNEADVIDSVIRHYAEDGVDVYLIDNCSTDGTAEVASELLGKGLLHIERFPDDVGGTARAKKEYMWAEILRRNEQLAAELGADWYIRADADEFRESPWPGLSHAEAIALVDALGYNAVQSKVLEFRPTDDGFAPGDDPRRHIVHYEPCEFSNMLWIKAWRQPRDNRVAIARSGGHQAEFAGRRVCPIHFISRHYPIRTSEHAKRKIFKERLDRYPKEEREMGWHTHWDELAQSGHDFLWNPDDLIRWDLGAAQADVLAESSTDILLTGMLHGVEAAVRPVTAFGLDHRFAHAIGGEGAMTEEGMRAVVEAARRVLAGIQRKTPLPLPEDPTFARACLTLLDMWIADRRTEGKFYDAAGLAEARALLLEHVRARHILSREPLAPEPVTAEPAGRPHPVPGCDVSRNAPCPCGSGRKFKKCHGLAAAA
jgi:hypothetical protein